LSDFIASTWFCIKFLQIILRWNSGKITYGFSGSHFTLNPGKIVTYKHRDGDAIVLLHANMGMLLPDVSVRIIPEHSKLNEAQMSSSRSK
jgi:hypothetical protein